MATILVVDDEMGIREFLLEILSDAGHIVELAENAQQARKYRQQHTPDLILLDIWMPDIDGITLLKEWVVQGQVTMPVIMMSSYTTIKTAIEATQIGAFNFLEKPISLQKLLKAIQQGLSNNNTLTLSSQKNSKLLLSDIPKISTRFAPNLSKITKTVFNTQNKNIDIAVLTATRLASISFDVPLREARDKFERAYFEYHLIRENGSMTKIAERTGLERTHLYRKMRHLQVDVSKNKRE